MWSLNDNPKRQTLKCPVCPKQKLGTRLDYEDKIVHCPDCDWTYHFKPILNTPEPVRKGTPDDDKEKCGCGGCGR